MKREHLKSRLGFILISAGCAIGIGNVWKFPYVVGENGGGAFVFIYLFFLLVLGVPILTMEFAIGRAAQKTPIQLYQELEPKGSLWHLHGYLCLLGNILLMMFYTVVAGMMFKYFVTTMTGGFAGISNQGITDMYSSMLLDPVGLIIYTYMIIIIASFVCTKGLQNGLEKVSQFMMVSLLGILFILVFNSLFIEGGKEGLSFYLSFDFEKIKEIGLGTVVVNAMNQAFFTLSIGMGTMAIFGSYIGKERALLGESMNIAFLDTFVAICSGLIIFPACSAYGVQVNSGPHLIFITLPNIFNHMTLGQLWGSLFFIFMTFAALSTVLAVFEAIISCLCDLFTWSRKKACLINCIFMLILCLPTILGFSVFSDLSLLGLNIMDFIDSIVSVWILPLGSLIVLLFCTRKNGWGWNQFVIEANSGKGIKIKKWMKPYLTYTLPILILVVFLLGVF